MPASSTSVDDKRDKKRKSDIPHQDSKKHQSKKQKVVAAALTPDASGSVRLHITPLTRETAPTIVPKTDISTISFHSVATFPEKSYAYVDLPVEDAEKVMKKYNGTVFRGVKMNVEQARKPKERKDEQDEEVVVDDKKETKSKKKEKKDRSKEDTGESKEERKKRRKMKKDEDRRVLSGVELPEGRQVQRGWTKDTKSTSKNQTKPECMFKVIIPPVVATRNSSSPSLSPTVSKISDKKKNKKVKGAQKNQVVVKEFENSTKFPQFLKMNNEAPSQKPAVEYIEEKGWVDEDGAVVDDRGVEKRKKQAERLESLEAEDKQSEKDEVETGLDSTSDDTSSNNDSSSSVGEVPHAKSDSTSHQSEETSDSNTSSELNSETEDSASHVTIPEVMPQSVKSEIIITSKIQEDTSEQESSSEEEQAEHGEVEIEGTKDNEKDNTSEDSSTTSSSKSETESVDEVVSQEEATEDVKMPEAKPVTEAKANIEGLSAMFKPSVSAQVESSSVFKFFPDQAEDDDEDEEMDDIVPEPATPMTPHDKRRRSAAPTPDTAVASRFPRHVIPLSPTREISAKYFAPQQEVLSSFGLGVSTGAEHKLLFPHTGSSFLHGLSLWSSLPMPKILTTGEVVERKGSTKEKRKGEQAVAEEEDEAEVEQAEPTKPEDYTMEDHHNLRMNKLQQASQKTDDQSAGRARTGAGSGIQGWTGKKKTFDDIDDNDNDNHRALNFAPPPIHAEEIIKPRTGAGSGIVGWAGKKKTFGDDEDTFHKPPQVQEDVATYKPKTGSGSGVVGWAGKKKTFDDIEEEEEVSSTVVAAVIEPSPQAIFKKPLLKVKTWDNETKEQQSAKDLTRAEIWKEVFYKKRGEWNREWKRRRREVAKAKRKRENSRRKV